MTGEKAPRSREVLDLDALHALAKAQPKVAIEDIGGRQSHTEFGGNFYRRILDIKAIADGTASDQQIIYARTIKERFGFDLLDFYSQNGELCSAIVEAIAAKSPYDTLTAGYQMLLEQENAMIIPVGSAEALNAAAEHPHDIEGIGIYYWDRINPLLEDAYRILEGITLNTPFLAR